MKKPKILSITIKHEIDDCPDTSFLGEYTNRPDEWCIDRKTHNYIHYSDKLNQMLIDIGYEIDDETNQQRKDRLTRWHNKLLSIDLDQYSVSHREYQYFKPYAGGEKPGTPNYKRYGKQDFERMEQLNNGYFCFLGIVATAEIEIPYNNGENSATDTINCSTWGIESDCIDYIEETEKDKLHELKNELKKRGFSRYQIYRALKNINRKD